MPHVLQGDCLEVMKGLPDNSVDAIICDPPCGIGFLNLAFDSDRGGRKQWVQWMTDRMAEAMRVLKPGGYALVWGIPKTAHWTGWALEEAGFEIKDSIHHVQGQGFPKGQSIDKAIDRVMNAEREVVGGKPNKGRKKADGWRMNTESGFDPVTIPATPEAAQWEGWNTQLKPSHEVWWLAQKPISEKTIAANVLRWNTGGLNIQATKVDGKRFPPNQLFSHHPLCQCVGEKRVKGESGDIRPQSSSRNIDFSFSANTSKIGYGSVETIAAFHCLAYCPSCEYAEPIASLKDCPECGDRMSWACPVALLDEQTKGTRASKPSKTGSGWKANGTFPIQNDEPVKYDDGYDSANASRFFPTFHEPKPVPFHYFSKASKRDRTCGGRVNNTHPTLKSHELMKWLTRLICPPGGTVLDCFAGSGSTGLACIAQGFDYILIEENTGYVQIIHDRIAAFHEIQEEQAKPKKSAAKRIKKSVSTPQKKSVDSAPEQLQLFG